MNKDVELRKIALETLIQIEKNNAPSHLVIKDVLDKYDYFSKNEKALISTIVKGTIERKIELDYVCDQFSKTPHNKMKLPIRLIIEMGIYQILYMKSYDTLAVNSSVELARKKGFSSLAGFVNAVLRNIVRNKDNIKYPGKEDKDYLSVKYSMPETIVNLLKEQYDFETLEKIFAASLNDDYVRIRIKEALSKEDKDKVIEEIKEKCTSVSENVDTPNLLKVKGLGNITALASFMNGLITVQDAGSYILCKNVPEGKNILDACSAPGGKSIFLSELYPESKITSCDISEDKISKIEENIARMKAEKITTKIADATEFNLEWEEKYDTVLADVPCSGLGVIGKKQDIKYRITEEGLNELYDLQKKIIDNVSRYVKKGGYLVYSTCTINKKENEDRIDEFLKNGEYSQINTVKLLQGIDDSDGFFISVLKKN